MDSIDAINLLKKYNLYEEAQNECRRKKLDKAPYDMQGHNEVYCFFLNKKWVELRDLDEKKKKCSCSNLDAVKFQNRAHEDCFFNRISFLKDGLCNECTLGKELDDIEKEMKKLSEATRVLKEAADYDYTWR